MKEYIYFGVFNNGKLLFTVWNTIPKTNLNIRLANSLCALAEHLVKPVLNEGDYLAFDYKKF